MAKEDIVSCELCRLVESEIKTHLWWEDENWIVVDCLTCEIPMAVYRLHAMVPDREDVRELTERFHAAFGEGSTRPPRKILNHFHLHWIRAT